jgi:hypothetical protein
LADATLTAPEAGYDPEHHIGTHATTTGISNNKLAMWVFLGSECMLFGGLISTYLLYKDRVPEGGIGGRRLRHPVHLGELVRAADELAHHGAGAVGHPAGRPPGIPHLDRHHRPARVDVHRRPGLRVHRLLPRRPRASPPASSARPSTRSPASTACTSPSASSCCVAVRAVAPRPLARTSEAVEIVGLYWHFVDIVWILIFTIVYLIP